MRTFLSLAALALVACGQRDDQVFPSGRTRETFQSVVLEEYFGSPSSPCEACVVDLKVDAQGVLTLEDSDGAEAFDLTPSELSDVLHAVLARDFLAALWTPDDCLRVPDAAGLVTVSWTDLEPVTDGDLGSCLARDTSGEHPYARLVAVLVGLRRHYLDCRNTDRFLCQT